MIVEEYDNAMLRCKRTRKNIQLIKGVSCDEWLYFSNFKNTCFKKTEGIKQIRPQKDIQMNL